MSSVIEIDSHTVHTGVIQSLMMEYETHRLPRLLRLKDKVDSGEAIDDVDLAYLCKELKDAALAMHMTVNYPESVSYTHLTLPTITE